MELDLKDQEEARDTSDDSSNEDIDDQKELDEPLLPHQEDNRKENETEFTHSGGGIHLGVPTASKDKRRERNKLLARKSRLKMKAEVEALKSQLTYLMKENEILKEQMNNIVTPAMNVAELVKSDIQLPDNISQLVKQLMARTEKTAVTPRKMKRSSFCIANAISVDVPIVYASPGFLKLTGYEMAEILGRNCRFLQGPKTDQREVARMKQAIIDGNDITLVLLNYRKDGKPFYNQVQLAHLKDQSGKTFLIVGIQTKVKQLPGDDKPSPAVNIASATMDTSRTASPLQPPLNSNPISTTTAYRSSIPSSSQVLLYPDMKYYRPSFAHLPVNLASGSASISSGYSNNSSSVGSGMQHHPLHPRPNIADYIPRNYLNTPLSAINPFAPEANSYYPFPARPPVPPILPPPRPTATTSSSSGMSSPYMYPPPSVLNAMNNISHYPSPSSSSPPPPPPLGVMSIHPPYYPAHPVANGAFPMTNMNGLSATGNRTNRMITDDRPASEYDYPPLPSSVYYDFNLPLPQPNLTAMVQTPAAASSASYSLVDQMISHRLAQERQNLSQSYNQGGEKEQK